MRMVPPRTRQMKNDGTKIFLQKEFFAHIEHSSLNDAEKENFDFMIHAHRVEDMDGRYRPGNYILPTLKMNPSEMP